MKNFSALLLLLINAVFLAACGQKGPLFLPGTPSTITTPVQEPASAEETEETEEERRRQNENRH